MFNTCSSTAIVAVIIVCVGSGWTWARRTKAARFPQLRVDYWLTKVVSLMAGSTSGPLGYRHASQPTSVVNAAVSRTWQLPFIADNNLSSVYQTYTMTLLSHQTLAPEKKFKIISITW